MIGVNEIGEAQLTGAEAAEPAEPVVHSRAAVLTALFITGFGTFLNVYSTQPLLPEFRRIFGASELLVSLTVSATIMAVAFSAPFVGMLADTIGRKRVIVAAMLGLAVPTALAATATNLTQLIFWRFLQGFFIPGIIAVAIAYISEESPGSVTSTMATYVTGTVVGGFAGRFLSGLGSTHWGWRPTFVGLGIMTIAAALSTQWLLPRARKFVRQRNAGASFRSLRRHLHNPRLLATYAVGFDVLFCLVGAFTYVNFHLADEPFHLGPTALGSIFAVYLIGAVITPFSGFVLDRIGCRRGLIGAVGMAALGMLLTLVAWIPAIVAGLTFLSTGVFICQAASSSHVGKAAGEGRSSAAGLYVALYYLGGSVGSVVPGFFWHRTGWIGCVVLIVCMQAVAAFIAHRLWGD